MIGGGAGTYTGGKPRLEYEEQELMELYAPLLASHSSSSSSSSSSSESNSESNGGGGVAGSAAGRLLCTEALEAYNDEFQVITEGVATGPSLSLPKTIFCQDRLCT